ncbi:hypothetical protein [Klebsiella aerogenes]|uniref:hypothetical protein n=1 Tax=Klebsiella aerogenes TaxID=548 RepID=UPI002278E18F|nr:hypothetical protein [Klebsiella aerogenes]MCY4764373.1 hypothetical protein [Klebsiella aerogenes]
MNPYRYAPNTFKWIDPLGLNKISSVLTFPDGSSTELPAFKSTPGAKSVPGRTEDAEQKLLRFLGDNYQKTDLKGSTLDITSEPSFISVKGKPVPIGGINPCDDCNRVMDKFAADNDMKVNYKCKKTVFSYPS